MGVPIWVQNTRLWSCAAPRARTGPAGSSDRYRTQLTDQAILKAVGDVEGLDVLDAGCGEGDMSRLLAERGGAAGVDVSDSLIGYAQTHEDAERLGVGLYPSR